MLSLGRAPPHVRLCGLHGQAALNLAFQGKLLCLSCLNLARESHQNRFDAGGLLGILELEEHLGGEQVGAAVSSFAPIRCTLRRIKRKMDNH